MTSKPIKQSLLYPIVVLTLSAVGLLSFPELTLELLFSNSTYSPEVSRLLGMFVAGLAAFVVLTYRLEIQVLYRWTLFIRLGFAICLLTCYLYYSNPLFLMLLAVLFIGMAWTLLALLKQPNELMNLH